MFKCVIVFGFGSIGKCHAESVSSICESMIIVDPNPKAFVNRFSVREPTLAEPIRRYIPVYDQTNEPLKISANSTFKPGFYSQGVEFLGILNGQSSANVRLATLDDARQSLKIAEQICREI